MKKNKSELHNSIDEFIESQYLKSDKRKTKMLRKINNLIDTNQFHLCRSVDHWSLTRVYVDFDVYMSAENKPVLKGSYTDEDLNKLYTYLKEHQKVDPVRVYFQACISIQLLMLVLCVLNIWIKNDILPEKVWSVNLVLMLIAVLMDLIRSRNNRTDLLFMNEQLEKALCEECIGSRHTCDTPEDTWKEWSDQELKENEND